MKKTALLLAAVLICSILGGCQPGDGTGSSQSGSGSSTGNDFLTYEYTYNPYALPSLIEEKLGDSLTAYKAVVDAVENREESVFVKDEDESNLITGILQEYYPPFVLVTQAEYNTDDSSLKLSYRYNGNVHTQKLSGYRAILERAVRLALKKNDSETVRAMALYLYATSSVFESGRTGLTAWDAINGETDHNGYAQILETLFLQADVDCLKTETKRSDGTPHLIVLTKLKDKYYYMDPYGETILSDGTGLAAFGMTRADCVKNGYLDSFEPKTGGCTIGAIPSVDDSRFSELRLCARWSFDDKRENLKIVINGAEKDWGSLL